MVFKRETIRELALFAGGGGGILGSHLLGFSVVCAVELCPNAREILQQRQRDGILSPFPIWDDVRTFEGKPWRGIIDVITAGFPCQDISSASPSGEGLAGSKSGLWYEVERIVCEVRPRFVFLENSPRLKGKGLERILAFFAELGMDAQWGVIGARHAGLSHRRDRIWILAYTNKMQR